MVKVILVGASGNAGSRILKELSDRGHSITAVARNPEKIASLPGVSAMKGDVSDKAGLVELLKGHEVAITSVHFTASDPALLISAVREAGVARYLVVGGAGSLEIKPGHQLVDQPDFPSAYKPEATKGRDFLELLKATNDIDWTFLSPSAEFVAGERTGIFRLGADALLSNDKGSSISFEDYAIALVDEIETPKHTRQRFTVGY